MPEHPTKKELSDFLLGMLPPESTDVVAEHLEGCPPCQETVNALDAHKDTLLEGLRQGQATPVDEECLHAIDRAVSIAARKESEGPTQLSSAAQPAVVAASPTLVPSREQFLAALNTAQVIDAERWSPIENSPAVAQAADGGALARALVENGTLTKFQATLIYQNEPKSLAFGEYVLLDTIGAGGMGQVFKAKHRRMDRVVALKVLAKAAINSPGAVKRFEREVKAAARLAHPNIVTAFDAGEAHGQHFLVMEFVDGRDLSDLVKAEGALPIDKAIDYLLQAARGLQFAHAEGVVHRDIKPANLLLDKKGTVKILDMGLARFDDATIGGADLQEGLTQSGQVMGTVDYMAPEQAIDTRTADAKADVYALGCTLHRLLIGENVYGGETLVQKLLAHREQPIPSLCSKRPDVPKALDDVFRRMVAKRPEERIGTMREVIEALQKIQKGMSEGESAPVISINVRSGSTAGRESAASPPKHFPRRSAAHSQANGSGRKPPMKRIAAAGAAGFLFVALGVWVSLRDKDGNEVARIPVPENGAIVVQTDSNAVPAPSETAAENAASPSATARLRLNQTSTTATALPDNAPPPAVAPFDAKTARSHQEAWAKHLGTMVEATNGIGMQMVLVPPGSFFMGSTDDQVEEVLRLAEETGNTDANLLDRVQTAERPRHEVVIAKPLLMSATEITIGHFKKFSANGYLTEAERIAIAAKETPRVETGTSPPKPIPTYLDPGYPVGDDMPAAIITWNDATAFCEWLSKQEKASYRLPTEAEWEYACRAGTTTHFSCGDDYAQLDQHGWHRSNSGGKRRTTRTKLPNPFGLFDMHGNLSEWCGDPYDTWAYRKSSLSPPSPVGNAADDRKVLRGGSWFLPVYHCRSASRNGISSSARYGDAGFRVVREIH